MQSNELGTYYEIKLVGDPLVHQNAADCAEAAFRRGPNLKQSINRQWPDVGPCRVGQTLRAAVEI